MDGYGINPMENVSGTTTDITLNNYHTWGCPVYVLDAILSDKIAVLPKWEPLSSAGIYLGNSQFNAGSVCLVINPATGHVSPQFHMVFYEFFSTVPFMREGKISQNWTDIVQQSSQICAMDNIYLKDTWFTADIEEYTSGTSSHEPRVAQ